MINIVASKTLKSRTAYVQPWRGLADFASQIAYKFTLFFAKRKENQTENA